jgi:hypothetical protein
MADRRILALLALLVVLASGFVASPSAMAQTPAYRPPRAQDGHTDLTGVWANPRAVTPLEKNPAFGEALVVPASQARVMADGAVATALKSRPLQADLTDHADLALVRGEYRTRQIVDPPDGKIPYLPAAQKAVDDWYARYARTKAGMVTDNPDELALSDRCISIHGQPPMPYATLFGGLRQIVQTHDHVLLYAEYSAEPRIVRMGGPFQPPAIRTLWGDSVGHWEGDVLVVETVNFRLDQPFHNPTNEKPVVVGPGSKVVERFTRVSDDEIDYTFTVEDPAIYARPWLGEYALTRTRERLFEFACHENNWAVSGILRGARVAEERAAKAKAGAQAKAAH